MVSTYFIIMKKLLMLGGGFLQNFVIKKAREMGYYVFCLDADPNALGFCQQMNMQLSILWMKKHVLHMLVEKM